MEQNPFAAPTDADRSKLTSPPKTDHFARVGVEVVKWEKMRLIYNFILVVVTIGCVFARLDWLDRPLQLMATLAFGAVAANLFYGAGTILGAYLAWIGYENRHFRWFVFICGSTLASALAIMTVVST